MKNLINSVNAELIRNPYAWAIAQEKTAKQRAKAAYKAAHPDVKVVYAPAKGAWLDFNVDQRITAGRGIYLFGLANQPGEYFATTSAAKAAEFKDSDVAWHYAAYLINSIK